MNPAIEYTEERQASPSKQRWEQLGAAGGIVFIIMQLASQALIQMGGAEPPFNASAAEIEAFFANRSLQLAAMGSFLSVLSAIPLLSFVGVLWARLRRHEGEPGWLSSVALGSGVVGVAILLGGGGGWELAILRGGEGLPAETLQLLFDQGNLNFATFGVALAALLLSSGVVALRDQALPRWLGSFGLLVAVGLLAVRAVWFDASGIKFLPYVLFWVWLTVASITLIRATGRGSR